MFLSRKDGLIADTRVTSSDKLASCHRLPQLALCPALKAVLAFPDDRVYSSFQLSIKDATVHSITTGGGLHEPVSSFTYIRLLAFLPETATYEGCSDACNCACHLRHLCRASADWGTNTLRPTS